MTEFFPGIDRIVGAGRRFRAIAIAAQVGHEP